MVWDAIVEVFDELVIAVVHIDPFFHEECLCFRKILNDRDHHPRKTELRNGVGQLSPCLDFTGNELISEVNQN